MIKQYNKKKICILMPYHWSYSMGGAEYQSKCIVEALSASGRYEIYFLARFIHPLFSPNDHKIIQIKNNSFLNKKRYFLDARSIRKELDNINPDIIYQRVGSAYTGIGARYIIKHGGKFIWHIARDDDISPAVFKPSWHIFSDYFEKKILEYGVRNATHIVAQTNDQAILLEQNYGRRPAAVIRNFHPVPICEGPKVKPIKIVWIANMKPNKRPDIFLSLVDSLRYLKDVEFIMIGDLQGKKVWRSKLLDNITRADNLKYFGVLSQENVNKVLEGAHIFINTSILEGFPNTFIQAWMRSVPTVSLTINPDNVFYSHEIGFCSESFDKLKEDVVRLVSDDSLRERMGRAARAYAIKNHSEDNAAELLSLFEN